MLLIIIILILTIKASRGPPWAARLSSSRRGPQIVSKPVLLPRGVKLLPEFLQTCVKLSVV